MQLTLQTRCTAFAGHEKIATGDALTVARAIKPLLDAGEQRPVHIVDDSTSQPVEIDFRGDLSDVLGRLSERLDAQHVDATPQDNRGPGRPKLGVVGREVTLLPRHWEWLATQQGGASVTLRRLVEEARLSRRGVDEARHAQDTTYRFMTAIAGDLPGYEEATRALYARDEQQFSAIVEDWPAGVRDHANRVAQRAWRSPE
jgi:hypothetical protein